MNSIATGDRDRDETAPRKPGEAAIVEAVEQRYRILIDHAPDAICVHQAGRVVYVNSAGVRRMGAHFPEQIVGHLITDFVHPDSIPPLLARIALLRNEGDASEASEAVILGLDGSAIDVEAISVLTLWEGQPAYQVVFRDLTAQKAAQATLRYQAALVSHVSDAIIGTTASGIVTSWNPAAEAIYGRPAAKALALPVSEAVGAEIDPLAVIGRGGVIHTVHHAAHGAPLTVRVSVAEMDNGYVLLCSDYTALHSAEQQFRAVVDRLDEGVVVFAPDGRVESANPAALRMLGITYLYAPAYYDDDALRFALCDDTGRPLHDNQHPVEMVLRTGREVKEIIGLDRPDGQRIWLSSTCCPLNADDPSHSSVLLSFVDVTAAHVASQRLSYQARHDALTSLPNRSEIVDRITHALASQDLSLSAVMFIDLDNLKSINDSLGHHAGDQVLHSTAQRLRDGLRADDVVGRFGGDEFVALLANPLRTQHLQQLAQRLHLTIAEPLAIGGEEVRVHVSIGITSIEPADHRTAEDLVRDADRAMYTAKTNGKGQTSIFRGEMLEYAHEGVATETSQPACGAH
ncbi:MAG TPA: diguanylate cyclase [Mycobacterium sp.]